ncbi:MAG: hypothetical protein ACJ8DY_14475 [Xanthobacteraceae bacterium]
MVERHHRAVRIAIIAAGAPFDVEHDLVGEQALAVRGRDRGPLGILLDRLGFQGKYL